MKWSFFDKKRNLSNTFRLYTIGFTLIVSIIFGLVYVYFQITNFNRQSKNTEQYFLNLSKESAKKEVEEVFDYIEYSRNRINNEMRTELKTRVNEAWEIAHSIYHHNQGKLSNDQIKNIIKEALRPLRFFDNKGYFFIGSMDGFEILNPIQPHLEGKNLINLQDNNGRYNIQDAIKLIHKDNQGYLTSNWDKPNDQSDETFLKTSFIKYFEPFDWYIGTGEYNDDIENRLKQQVISRIKFVHFGVDGYIFVNTYDFVAVIIDSPVYKAGDTLSNVIDPNGIDIMAAEKRLSLKPGGGFFEYSWPRKGTDIIAPKVSFVKGYKEWEWMIGAGLYIDDIETLITEERSKLNRNLLIQISIGVLIFIVVFILVYFTTITIAKSIKSNFEIFTEKLRAGFWTGKLLEHSDYSIKDFEPIINNINDLIKSKLNAENLLSESENRFRTIFENSPVMILILDESLNYISSNQEIQKFFDIDNNIQQDKLNLEDVLITDKQNRKLASLFKRADGRFKEFNIKTIQGLKSQNWAIFKTDFNEVIAVGYDISELKENQEQLKELNETKDKFFSVLSHDLRTPFNSILGHADVMYDGYDSFTDAQRRHSFGQISESSSRMFKMLTNLLNWARTQTGSIKVRNSFLRLNDIAEDIIIILSTQANKKNIRLINSTSKKDLVYADKTLLTTIIQNLISNSIKFTNEEGSIELTSEFTKTEVMISVIDNGVGIEKNILENIFDISQNKSNIGTHDEIGTGLGLVICKEFLEKMNGKIWAESEVDKGTKFTFSLPLKKT